ncbi:dihydrofolate reductase family protein [Luteimonas sp. A478]
MRRVIGGAFISVDGVVQAPGGPEEDPTGGFDFGGWATPYFDDTLSGFLGEVFGAPEYDLLLGRRTYEIFAAHWPYQTDDPMGQMFDRIRKYVVTSTPELLTWKGSQALVGDPASTVAELKHGDGPDLLIQGSSELYPALLGARLIDRLFLVTMPVILGRGKRLFSGAAAPTGLKLVDHRIASTGAVVTVYEQAGEVATGSFASETPSAAELARRDKIKHEAQP